VSLEEDRLVRCFQATFEGLAPSEVQDASVDTLEQWDSLHTVILVAVLEEEFAIRIPAQAFPALRSYVSVHDYLNATISR
jgi:acyl carrier protein